MAPKIRSIVALSVVYGAYTVIRFSMVVILTTNEPYLQWETEYVRYHSVPHRAIGPKYIRTGDIDQFVSASMYVCMYVCRDVDEAKFFFFYKLKPNTEAAGMQFSLADPGALNGQHFRQDAADFILSALQ